MGSTRVPGPHEGKSGMLGSMGVRFMIDGSDSGLEMDLSIIPELIERFGLRGK
jgi:hypothetical protein